MGLTISETNDQRFDIDDASWAAAKYLKMMDGYFSKETTLIDDLKTIAINDCAERKKFSLAAYNGGEGRIAGAQKKTQQAEKDPLMWSAVKDFLEAAGALPDKAEEIITYVENVLSYEIEFSKKSSADKEIKHKKESSLKEQTEDGHWVTIDGQPVLIKD